MTGPRRPAASGLDAGPAAIFRGADLRAIERDNALRILSRLRGA